MPRQLLPVRLGADPTSLERLRAGLSGAGPAVLPLPFGATARATDLTGTDDEPTDATAVAIATSGSTGEPRQVMLPASALFAAAAASHDRLGGPGRWLLALPTHHIAGLMVLVRSLVARTTPVALEPSGGFDPVSFAKAARALTGHRRYTSLVPTQLRRIVAHGGEPLAALAALDAVLVGAAALPGELGAQAERAGVRVISTYGMSETCGGCVYDGRPLDGVRIVVHDNRIQIGGDVVARGYRGERFGRRDGVRWVTTSDLGTWDGERLTVTGRADDVVVTGGANVAPAAVEAALLALPEVADAVVVGVPDDDLGQVVAAAVVWRGGALGLDDLRSRLGGLAPAMRPRRLVTVDSVPLRGVGKPDRDAVRAMMQG